MTAQSPSRAHASLVSLTRIRNLGTEWALLALVTAFGAILRFPGFSTTDLWYDDAWAAMPAKEPLGVARHMVVTTPGYTLFNREWILLHPGSTPWAQAPAFLLGVAAIPIVYLALRSFAVARWATWVGVAVVTVSPTTVTYSTRVKEYAADFLLACLVLVLTERVRTNRTSPWWLVAASVGAVVISASTMVVVIPAWGVVALVVWTDGSRRRTLVPPLVAAVVLSGACALAISATVPNILNANWRRRGFLGDWSSAHAIRFSLQSMFAGLAHNLLAIPSQPAAFHGAIKVATAVLAIAVGVAVVGLAVVAIREGLRLATPGPLAVPAATLALAAVLGLCGFVPLGDGRTDEVLYPAIILAFGLVASRLRLPAWTALTTVRAGVTAACILAFGLFGVTHTARYPTINLRGLAATLHEPTYASVTTLVVESFDGFTWGYDDLSPNAVVLGKASGLVFPMGFHVVSTVPNVVIGAHNGAHVWPRDLRYLSSQTKSLWYIGYELGTYDPYRPQGSTPQFGPVYQLLEREGWHRTLFPVLGQHCFALLMTHA
jgi:Dolichyl-phosphate-mannose-protein mannosyltransferase